MIDRVLHLNSAELSTRRLALRLQLSQSLLMARAEGAAAALERMGLPDIANGLRVAADKAGNDSQALLTRMEQP